MDKNEKDILLKNFILYAYSDDKERERMDKVADDYLEAEKVEA